MDTTAPAAGIQLAASLLAAYLDTDDLPSDVEMCCLLAGDELQRAGADTNMPFHPCGPVELQQVLDALLDLPRDAFDDDHVLNAVAALNDAVDALAGT